MDDVEAIAALHDPVRRRLYDYVVAQDHDVGRAEAADAAGIQRTLAAFHLDRLAGAGLLDVVRRRPPGRSGPGAGRPAKLYRRSAADRAVSLPPRDYRAAAGLLAEAVEATGAEGELERVARSRGHSAGARARSRAAGPETAGTRAAPAGTMPAGTMPAESVPVGTTAAGTTGTTGTATAGPEAVPGEVRAALAARGYAPYEEAGAVRMRNCPFHALAVDFPPLVCGMNLAFLEGFLAGFGAPGLAARIEPRPGECCVIVTAEDPDSKNNNR